MQEDFKQQKRELEASLKEKERALRVQFEASVAAEKTRVAQQLKAAKEITQLKAAESQAVARATASRWSAAGGCAGPGVDARRDLQHLQSSVSLYLGPSDCSGGGWRHAPVAGSLPIAAQSAVFSSHGVG